MFCIPPRRDGGSDGEFFDLLHGLSSSEAPFIADVSGAPAANTAEAADADRAPEKGEMETQMVSSSMGAMGSLLRKLHSLLMYPEHQLPTPLKPQKQIELLKQDLEQMTAWLVDLSRAEAPSKMAKHWMNEVRDLSYDLEDYIDNTMRSCSGTNELEEFSTLLKQVGDARRRYERYEIWRQTSNPSCIVEEHGLVPTLSRETRNIVGIGDSKAELIKRLTNQDEQQLKVVSILGPEGVGKTTLATEVFREIRGQFECRAFARASKMPDARRLLRSIISQVQSHQLLPYAGTVQDLIDNLSEHLQNKRYFIVIDGLWETTSWDIVNSAFPDSTNHSRILITTYNEEVALECSDYQSDGILDIEPLCRSYPLELFFSTVFGSKYECSEKLKKASEEIVRICGGLPLATISIASILASQLDNSKLWDNVQQALSSSMGKNLTPQDMLIEIVGLSYNSLSSHLKTCLLYLSLYPEGYTFSKADLVKQWSAESFITVLAGKESLEAAGCYLDELVFRGFIQPYIIDFSDEVMFYTVHSTVFEVIRYKSIEENFTTVIDCSETIPKLSAKVRRLSLRFSNAKYATKPEGITLSHTRSLIFFGLSKCLPSIMDFKLLRILILEFWGDKEDLELGGIDRLFQLRYVRITTDMTVNLPCSMQGMLYLETLEIHAREMAVPADVVDLPSLLHLCLQVEGTINLPEPIGHLKSLRTLQCFDLSSNSESNVRSLGQMTNLHDLHLNCSAIPSDNQKRNLISLVSSLEKLGNLKSVILTTAPSCMSINLYCSSSMSSPPVTLQRLELMPPICLFSRLPIWIGKLRKLRILKIVVRELMRGDLDSISILQELTILNLYVRKPTTECIIFHRNAFPALKCFKFRCGVLSIAFQAEALPSLLSLKLEFNAHSAEQYSVMLAGIENLANLQEITGRIGTALGAEESDRMAVESLFKDAISKHSKLRSFNLETVSSFDEEICQFAIPPASFSSTDEQLNRPSMSDAISGLTEIHVVPKVSAYDYDRPTALQKYEFKESVTPRDLSLRLIEDITKYFSDEQKIGSGQYGEVYKGVYNGREIAVKKLYQMPGLDDVAIQNEFHNLMKVQHKNIIQLIGYCYQTQQNKHMEHKGGTVSSQVERVLCFEYLEGGCLERQIYDESCGPDWQTRFKLIKGTCEGLNFLHNGHKDPIYHLNLKPANVLLDMNMVPKIADFGLLRLFDSETNPKTETTIGTTGYMPPEFIEKRQISNKFDVFSLGVIILQIMAGPEGYSKSCEMSPQEYIELIHGNWNKRLQVISQYTSHEADCTGVKKCIEIALRCVETDHVKRPTMKEIVDELSELDKEIEKMVQLSIEPPIDPMRQRDSASAQQSVARKRPAGARAASRKRGAEVQREVLRGKRQILKSSSSSSESEHEKSEVRAAAAAAVMRGGGRRLWVKERDRAWWDRMSSPACPEAEFRRAFRMSRGTFEALCEELGAAVANDDTMVRAVIPVRQRVAVCIWRLATGEPLRLVSKRFGLGISTCHKLVLEACAAIKAVLMPKAVQWPENPDTAAGVAAGFQAVSGIPNVVGAIYTTHIPIIAPKANVAAYYNRRHTERNQKTSYSITVQGVVDAGGAFTDVCIGWPGSMSDAEVLERSALYAQRGAAGLLQGQWVVGGAGYPLMDWLLVPYALQDMTWAQHVFNEKVDAVCAVARDAFQRLKARWACIQRRTEVKLQDLPIVLGACCVLHNICERAGDAVDPEVSFQLFDDDMVAENPVRSQDAANSRDAIARKLFQVEAPAAGDGSTPVPHSLRQSSRSKHIQQLSSKAQDLDPPSYTGDKHQVILPRFPCTTIEAQEEEECLNASTIEAEEEKEGLSAPDSWEEQHTASDDQLSASDDQLSAWAVEILAQTRSCGRLQTEVKP
ncbi:hypothetical protein ACP70R_001617 [Stipagrostis hirtigluma subsp. patula]